MSMQLNVLVDEILRLKRERSSLDEKIEILDKAYAIFSTAPSVKADTPPPPAPAVSVEQRRGTSVKKKRPVKKTKLSPARKPRKLSAEAREKIAAAQRRRWAAVKEGK